MSSEKWLPEPFCLSLNVLNQMTWFSLYVKINFAIIYYNINELPGLSHANQSTYFYTLCTMKFFRAYIDFYISVCLSICPFICLPVCSTCHVYSLMPTESFHIRHKWSLAWGCVSRNDLWPWPISTRSFSHDFEIKLHILSCPLCSNYNSGLILSLSLCMIVEGGL